MRPRITQWQVAASLLMIGLCGLLPSSREAARADIPLEPDPSRIHADVTAYSSSPDETWGDPFVTASGRPVGEGVVACPRRLPFGTRVRIGRLTYTCWDRLHPKYDHRFDIWKPSKEEALQFGRRRVVVQIL
jgi:3D (Asp-Asp-Asp) domain-containing protein